MLNNIKTTLFIFIFSYFKKECFYQKNSLKKQPIFTSKKNLFHRYIFDVFQLQKTLQKKLKNTSKITQKKQVFKSKKTPLKIEI
ncbi:hypothetical protein B6A10_15585 [Flavobacterium sp. L1I52]|uniref:Transmembrane protein n=1 Tax=Flavobacterium pokkalii TaxID=1940408 RepID=A0ABR7UUU8_9FLAO|nr:hypothetical protein [Flavobacterium pokkalii]